MLIGYELLRKNPHDSAVEQANLKAIDRLKRAGCLRIYIDFFRGDRSQLKKAFSALANGDTLVISKLDQLGDSRKSLLQNLNFLTAKGIFLQSLSESLLLPSESLSTRDLIDNLFPLESEASDSITTKKTQNKRGRREVMTAQKCELVGILLTCQPNINVSQICETIGVSRQSFYTAKKKGKLAPFFK